MPQSEPYRQRDHLEYPSATMYEMIRSIAGKYPRETAYEFYNRKTSYSAFLSRIETAARAFLAAGIKKGDAVTICLPNVPQAIDAFYALNCIGAVANMVHPLSARDEITYFVNFSESRMILTLDMFCEKVEEALQGADHPVTLLVGRIQDELPAYLFLPYTMAKGRPYLKFPTCENSMTWKAFLKKADKKTPLPEPDFDPKRTSVILYSGGTSGEPKGICLSDLNFNALALQAVEAIGAEFHYGLTMLSCMPCFHGFGLGINLHTVLVHGVTCILMPTFSSKTYANMLIKKRPNYIAGVPTIFEALLHLDELEGKDLSHLMGMFCGGDSLSVELKKKIDGFLKDHGASIQVREGYGLTECVTASCLTPRDEYRENSIGIPFPDTVYAIVHPGTDEVLHPGEEGEIILRGPTVMLGYLKNPEETARTLRRLADGNIWLYTGDLGYMDKDGYVYFRQRIKRMIITNGYNVYPGQIENVIDSCEEVAYSCVIGIKDPRRMQRVAAYIVLRDGYTPSEELKAKIMDTLKLKVAKYALPREIEFRDELPKTLVGKVAYRLLEEEANRQQEAGKES